MEAHYSGATDGVAIHPLFKDHGSGGVSVSDWIAITTWSMNRHLRVPGADFGRSHRRAIGAKAYIARLKVRTKASDRTHAKEGRSNPVKRIDKWLQPRNYNTLFERKRSEYPVLFTLWEGR